jgi:hypothetical protein
MEILVKCSSELTSKLITDQFYVIYWTGVVYFNLMKVIEQITFTSL